VRLGRAGHFLLYRNSHRHRKIWQYKRRLALKLIAGRASSGTKREPMRRLSQLGGEMRQQGCQR
jgi:hypothetical protein